MDRIKKNKEVQKRRKKLQNHYETSFVAMGASKGIGKSEKGDQKTPIGYLKSTKPNRRGLVYELRKAILKPPEK